MSESIIWEIWVEAWDETRESADDFKSEVWCDESNFEEVVGAWAEKRDFDAAMEAFKETDEIDVSVSVKGSQEVHVVAVTREWEPTYFTEVQ